MPMCEPLRLTFLGTGDPFGTGGRLQSAILLDGSHGRVLLDCGATTPLALARAGIDPNTIDGIIITHWHGDHAGGLPNLALDLLIGARHGVRRAQRRAPLWVAGPAGTDAWLRGALETFGWAPPAGDDNPLAGLIEHRPLVPGERVQCASLAIVPSPAVHTPEALCLRVEYGGRIVGYSGDTAWTEALVEVADGADLFICQTYSFEQPQRSMLSYRLLAEQRARLRCRRLILTHVGPELQSRLADVPEEVAEDGLSIEL
jgi:ribonuclease BN (tRNA processing enzyme)